MIDREPGDEPDDPDDPKPRLRIRSFREMRQEFTTLNSPVIVGLVRVCEVINIIAATKFGKSWFVAMMALSIAVGRDLLGRFPVIPGRVLIIDNELHGATFRERMETVAEAMGLTHADYEDQIDVISMREDAGQECELMDIRQLSMELGKIRPGTYSMVFIDAWYRCLPEGVDENSNGDIARLYNVIDRAINRMKVAFGIVHHSTKGNQSGKSVTDVGAGAGAQSRAADTHLILRAHDEPGAVVVDAAVRSWAPLEPFVMRWNFPLWSIDDGLSALDFKQDSKRNADSAKQMNDRIATIKILEKYESRPEGDTASAVCDSLGMNAGRFGRFQKQFLESGYLEKCQVKKANSTYSGYRLSMAGCSELQQLRQLRQTREF